MTANETKKQVITNMDNWLTRLDSIKADKKNMASLKNRIAVIKELYDFPKAGKQIMGVKGGGSNEKLADVVIDLGEMETQLAELESGYELKVMSLSNDLGVLDDVECGLIIEKHIRGTPTRKIAQISKYAYSERHINRKIQQGFKKLEN